MTMKFKEQFQSWLERDAEWWEFWHPSSGLVGGLILGLLISTISLFLFS